MSHDAIPISPTRFAEALNDLPLSTLHLKAAELRNSIAHLDYSNEQLKPFTEGTANIQDSQAQAGVPDQDCIDAIKENEVVIARMEQRIALLKAEVESRGANWREFMSAEAVARGKVDGEEGQGQGVVNGEGQANAETNGVGGHEAWRDGTFQTGRITDGQVVIDGQIANGQGGSLDDEALRRALEERMNEDGDDEDGMHL